MNRRCKRSWSAYGLRMRAQEARQGGLTLKVSEKGGISLYRGVHPRKRLPAENEGVVL